MGLKIGDAELSWLGHASFKIKAINKIVYIDPYQTQQKEPADIILITHSHYDHCSIADINRIAKDNTTVICTASCQSSITKIDKRINMQVIQPNESIKIGNIKIQAVPAYNIAKPFHPKSEGWVGYVIEIGNAVIYHAGDTDCIKEMERLTGHGKKGNQFTALLPVGGKFTMNAEEAAQAAGIIKPSLAIPMHYGSVAGTKQDAENFVKLCNAKGINARILERE